MSEKARKRVVGQGYELLLGDAFELMHDVPSQSVDVILTDPPYNLSKYSTGDIHFPDRKALKHEIAEWDADFDPADVAEEFARILKPTGNIFAFTCYHMIGRWHEIFDPVFDTFQIVVWHKTNPPPQVRKTSFLNSCEFIVCCWNKGHKWNFLSQREMHNFIESPICMGAERWTDPVHPTQKPVAVLRHLLRIASDPGDLVFDPFMGVGSTGVAALELGRRFLGIEVDEKYFAAACRRMECVRAPLPLEED